MGKDAPVIAGSTVRRDIANEGTLDNDKGTTVTMPSDSVFHSTNSAKGFNMAILKSTTAVQRELSLLALWNITILFTTFILRRFICILFRDNVSSRVQITKSQ